MNGATMNIEIRPAQPNREDAVAFAELANMASHDLVVELIGKNYRQILAQMYVRDDNAYSYRLSHFATVQGKIAGLIFALHVREKAALGKKADQLLMRYAGLDLPRCLWMSFRLKQLFAFMDATPVDAFYLQCLAVYPQFRGQGIGKLLLAKTEDLARAEHARTFELDVEADNEIAIKAYQGQGMRMVTCSSPFYFRKQRRYIVLHRMAKTLD